MLKKRCGAALLSLCLCLGLCCPAYAGEAEPSPKTEAQTEGPDNPAGYYAPAPVKPGEMTPAAPRAGSVSYPVEGGNLYFDPETGTITDCDRNVTRADIPGEIGGAAVTAIGDCAFDDCPILAAVSIPDSVTSIGRWAFSGCSALTGDLVIPGGVESIGNNAFDGCSGLTSVTIPGSVKSIGEYAFFFCSGLAAVTIPGSVESIGPNAFSNCSGLAAVTFSDGVASIGEYAFFSCSALDAVTIPGSVKSIGTGAFQDCTRLAAVTFSDGVESIGIHAFTDCTRLTGSLVIPGSVKSIGEFAFRNCSGLAAVTFSDGVESIGNYAFDGCSGLTGSLVIPSSVKSIGNEAFHRSRFTEVVVDSENARYASMNGALIDLAGGFDGDYMVLLYYPAGSPNTSFAIPEGVDSIDSRAFDGCGRLSAVTIPGSVRSIGLRAFSNCSGLTSVTIPAGVSSIGEGVFDGCFRLTEISVAPENRRYSSIDGVLFYNPYSGERFSLQQYPAGRPDASYTVPDGAAIIRGAFRGCSSLVRVEFPDSVTSIGYGTFEDCTGLVSVSIPDSVKSIGSSAFRGCSGLVSVSIPDSVTLIDSGAFRGCSGLVSVEIPNSVTSIGYSTFKDCTGLVSVSIPDSVSAIDIGAFQGCSSLASVFYAGSESDWQKITIAMDNASLRNAVKYYGFRSVAVTGSFASLTGAGSYEAGTAVTLHAGTRQGWTFTGWTIQGATLPPEVLKHPDLTFPMPENAVRAAANWKKEEAPPVPSLPTVTARAEGPAVRLTVTGGELPENVKVLAALGEARFASALFGTYDAAKAEAVFPASLEKNERLFFLDPDTLIPLAKPAVVG